MSERSKDFKDFPVAAEIKALVPHIHPPAVNPAPMALFAFGLTTALLQVKQLCSVLGTGANPIQLFALFALQEESVSQRTREP